jgi:hypothetical protein
VGIVTCVRYEACCPSSGYQSLTKAAEGGGAVISVAKWKEETMALVLKGEEFVTTEALSASMLSGLVRLARRKPLFINGMELHHQDLALLAEEAERTGKSIWPGHVRQTSNVSSP